RTVAWGQIAPAPCIDFSCGANKASSWWAVRRRCSPRSATSWRPTCRSETKFSSRVTKPSSASRSAERFQKGNAIVELDPLDEHPIHQVPLSMAYTATSDRNTYDRCIYQALDHTGENEMLTGLGVYPNLGVIDAFASVRCGDKQWSIQTSGIRPADKMKQEVGPYKLEVVEPFRELHLTCAGDEHGVGFDLTFRSEYEPMREPQHIKYGG